MTFRYVSKIALNKRFRSWYCLNEGGSIVVLNFDLLKLIFDWLELPPVTVDESVVQQKCYTTEPQLG